MNIGHWKTYIVSYKLITIYILYILITGYYIRHLRNLRLWILFLWPDTNSYRLFFLSNILSHTPLRTIKRWFVWKFPWNKSNAGHQLNLITCFCHQTLMVRYLFSRSVTTLAMLNMTDPFQMKQIGYFRYLIFFSFLLEWWQ